MSMIDLVKLVIERSDRHNDQRAKQREAEEERRRRAPLDAMECARRFTELLAIVEGSEDLAAVNRALVEARLLTAPPAQKPIFPAALCERVDSTGQQQRPDLTRIEALEERFTLEVRYLRNPAVPIKDLLADGLPERIPLNWRPGLVEALIGSLPNRNFRRATAKDVVRDIRALTSLAIKVGADPRPIVDFVVKHYDPQWLTPGDLERLLAASRGAGATAEKSALRYGAEPTAYSGPHYLQALREAPLTTRVDVLAAVSRDVLEACQTPAFIRSRDRSLVLLEFATSFLDQYQTFGQIAEVAVRSPKTNVDSDEAAALMLNAIAAVSPHWEPDHGGGDPHLLMRILERLPDVLTSFQSNTAAFKTPGTIDLLTHGIERICEKCPDPTMTGPTVAAAKRLVPSLDITQRARGSGPGGI